MAFIYSNISALHEAYAEDPNSFPIGTTVLVRHFSSKRKIDTYRLESMISLRTSVPSVHWIYQEPPPKSRRGFNWDAYRQGK